MGFLNIELLHVFLIWDLKSSLFCHFDNLQANLWTSCEETLGSVSCSVTAVMQHIVCPKSSLKTAYILFK